MASNLSPGEGNSSHRSLYRASSLAPTEVDPVTATSNLNTPFLGDASPTPRADFSRNGRRRGSREGGPLDYLYDDPRTPYFENRVRQDEGRHGWLHPLPGSSTSTSVLYQHQRENRASRASGLGFGEQSSNTGELTTPGDSPAQAQLQHHRASTYSLNDPVPHHSSSNSTRFSSSSSPRFPTSISPVPQTIKRSEPDRFVKAVITARPQPHLTSSFSTSSTSPSGLGSMPGQKRLSRGAGSATSLGSGSSGKGIALKTMARGPDGQVVVAGNEGTGDGSVFPEDVRLKTHIRSVEDLVDHSTSHRAERNRERSDF